MNNKKIKYYYINEKRALVNGWGKLVSFEERTLTVEQALKANYECYKRSAAMKFGI